MAAISLSPEALSALVNLGIKLATDEVTRYHEAQAETLTDEQIVEACAAITADMESSVAIVKEGEDSVRSGASGLPEKGAD
jgi:hypothetical protein